MRHFASGLRRQAPEPLHGASTSTRSQRPARSASTSAPPRGARTWTLRAPERVQPLEDRRQAPAVGVGGVDLALVGHHRRQRQRLAAGAGAEVERLHARLGAAEQRRQLRAFVLHLDQALRVGRLGGERRAAAVGRDRRCAARSATAASATGAEMGERRQRRVAVALQRVDAQVDRRALASALPSSTACVAEALGERRRQPFGKVAAHVRGRAG